MIDWLKTHWFLLTALVAVGTAWGQQQQKIITLEDSVKSQVEINKRVIELQEQNARVEERTKIIYELLINQNKQLQRLENKRR